MAAPNLVAEREPECSSVEEGWFTAPPGAVVRRVPILGEDDVVPFHQNTQNEDVHGASLIYREGDR
jgi:hypothetical protein